MYREYPPQLRYVFRAIIHGLIIILQFPFHVFELLIFKYKIESRKISKPPIIIIGYWRSGTTYLQRLLCLDKRFGRLTQYQALFPLGSSIHSLFFKSFVNLLMKVFQVTHPGHNVQMDMDFPSEEDVALISSGYAYTPMWSHIYCHEANYFMKEFLVFEAGSQISKKYIEMYSYMVKWLSYFGNGKQLVLKNPGHTTKIHEILQAFPEAKFIYLKREANDVYFSNMKLMYNNRHQWLQDMNENEMQNFFLTNYPRVIKQYKETKSLIPESNLIEINFELFYENPLDEIKNIYKKFDLDYRDQLDSCIMDFLRDQHGKGRHHYNEILPKKAGEMIEDLNDQYESEKLTTVYL